MHAFKPRHAWQANGGDSSNIPEVATDKKTDIPHNGRGFLVKRREALAQAPTSGEHRSPTLNESVVEPRTPQASLCQRADRPGDTDRSTRGGRRDGARSPPVSFALPPNGSRDQAHQGWGSPSTSRTAQCALAPPIGPTPVLAGPEEHTATPAPSTARHHVHMGGRCHLRAVAAAL